MGLCGSTVDDKVSESHQQKEKFASQAEKDTQKELTKEDETRALMKAALLIQKWQRVKMARITAVSSLDSFTGNCLNFMTEDFLFEAT